MSPKIILVIDEDVASRNFIIRNLQNPEYEIIQAGSGKEGLIYAWRDHPDLVVVDPTIADISGEEFAIKLKQDARTAHLPLIAFCNDQSMARTNSCIDAGFNEYIVKSGQAMPKLLEVVRRRLGISEAIIKKGGLLMVFLSAKGGIGTSSICANIATNVKQSRPQARVAVLDMVLPIGSIASIVGYEGTQNIVSVTEMPQEEVTTHFFHNTLTELNPWHFHLLAGSPDPESSNHLKAVHIGNIVSTLQEAYDFVLIDIGRSLSKITLPLIQNADLNVLIISTDTSTLSLTKTVWKYMKSKDVSVNSLFPILNRAVSLEGLSKPETEKALGIPVKAVIPYLGSNLSLANIQHQPYSLKYPKDTTSQLLVEAAKEMSTLAHNLRAK